jgi:endoglucanase
MAGLACCAPARANCDAVALRGVNLSGAEFGKLRPGMLFKDYTYPSRDTLRYFRDQGMNIIRLPLLWERIQRAPFAPLDVRELAALQQVVRWGQELKLCVLLDLHNYGGYHGKKLGSPELSTEALSDVWLRLHHEFADPSAVAFGLMNEPAALGSGAWMAAAQATVLALRDAGARNWLMVPSPRWSGAHEFEKPMAGISAAEAFSTFKDPLNHYAIELHQYADGDYSGTTSQCIDPARLRTVMERASTWARLHKARLFLGEFGVANTPPCLVALQALLEGMQDNSVWLGWTYWSAGAWWGTYPLSIQPANPAQSGAPLAAQLTVLLPFLKAPTP